MANKSPEHYKLMSQHYFSVSKGPLGREYQRKYNCAKNPDLLDTPDDVLARQYGLQPLQVRKIKSFLHGMSYQKEVARHHEEGRIDLVKDDISAVNRKLGTAYTDSMVYGARQRLGLKFRRGCKPRYYMTKTQREIQKKFIESGWLIPPGTLLKQPRKEAH